jgi:hypothetical protein
VRQDRFSAGEESFFRSSPDPVLSRLCSRYARAFNLIEESWFDDLFAEDAVYESQVVTDRLEGREAIIEYLEGKLETLRQCGPDHRVRMELAEFVPDRRPCLVVYQREGRYDGSGLGRRIGLLILTARDEARLGQVFMAVVVPRPESARGSGVFPGIPKSRIDTESRPPHTRPPSRDLTGHLFLLDGQSPLDRQMKRSVHQALSDLRGASSSLVIHRLTEGDGERQAAELGVFGFPALVVEAGGHVILRVEGYRPPEELRPVLEAYLERPLDLGARRRPEER